MACPFPVRKRLLKLVCLILLIPLLPFGLLVFERFRGKVSLARYKRQLIAQGEKLSARDFASPLTNGDNGAPEIFEAAKQLKEGVVMPNNYPPRMRLTPAGRAVVCSFEDEWIENKVTNHWEDLASDLQTNAATLERIRLALEKPVLDSHLDLSQAAKMNHSPLITAKSLAAWFGAVNQLALHEGKTHEATRALIAEAHLPRLLAQDHIAISELVRIAIAAIARTDIWEALQHDEWAEADLASLQGAWEAQDFATAMAHGLEGEFVFVDAYAETMRKSNEDTFAAIYGWQTFLPSEHSERTWWEEMHEFPALRRIAEFLKKQVYLRLWRFAWIDQEEFRSLQQLHKLIETAQTCAAQKSAVSLKAALARLASESENKNVYDRLRYPGPNSVESLLRSVNRAMRAETERSIVLCAIALKRYSLRHGKSPESLDALVPEFLHSVPIDYMDGKPMRYRLKKDSSFILYSVGEDGKDDGGDGSLMSGKQSRQNLWDRKDFVWPATALPEEAEAYRKEAAKK